MQKVIIKTKLDNWNSTINKSRTNRMYANKSKKAEMESIRQEIGKLYKISKYPVKMVFKWHIKSVISDLDNKSVKNILDQLQKSEIIENDNIKYIDEIRHIAIKDKENFVEMEIYENGDRIE